MRKLVLALLLIGATAVAQSPNQMLIGDGARQRVASDPNTVAVFIGRTAPPTEIPGAEFLPLSAVATTRDGIPNEMPAPDEVARAVEALGVASRNRVVFFDDELGMLAARAWTALDLIGFRNAALLDGGLPAWQQRTPAVSVDGGPKSGEILGRKRDHENNMAQGKRGIKPKPQPGRLVTLADMRTLARKAGVVLVDARAPEEFRGEKPGEGVKRPGHIPGAVNIFWKQHLVSETNPVLKPKEELRKMYAAAGVVPGKKVIAYCRTGVMASHTYFVLRYLGYDVALYDGSFIEWSAQPDTPVEK